MEESSCTSTTKKPDHKKEQFTICVTDEGGTMVDFFPVSFSEFMIDCVFDKKERDRLALTGCRKIYCG